MIKKRIGALRVTRILLEQDPPWLRSFISEIKGVQKLQALQNGGYLDAVDFIGIHPQFEEVDDDGGPIQVYAASPSDNGRVRVRLVQPRPEE